MRTPWLISTLFLCLPIFAQTPIPDSQLTPEEQALVQMMGIPPVPDSVATAVQAVGAVIPSASILSPIHVSPASPSTAASTAPSAPATSTSCVKSPSFYVIGGSFNKAATPNLAGIFAVGVPLTCATSSFQGYSYTEQNIIPIGSGKSLSFKEVTSTGFALPLRQIGPLDLFAFGNIGASVNGTSTSLTGAYGGMVVFPLWKGSAWRGMISGQKISGNNIYSVMIGRSWK